MRWWKQPTHSLFYDIPRNYISRTNAQVQINHTGLKFHKIVKIRTQSLNDCGFIVSYLLTCQETANERKAEMRMRYVAAITNLSLYITVVAILTWKNNFWNLDAMLKTNHKDSETFDLISVSVRKAFVTTIVPRVLFELSSL